MDVFEPRTAMLLIALTVGAIFGVTARLTAFCFRSAVLELLARRIGFQAVAWAFALAIAVTATQLLSFTGTVDVSESIYLSSSLPWLTLALGGVLFGVGMILARGCGARHMVLVAGGNLRSAIVLSVLGIVAYMTLRGILAVPRTSLEAIGTLDIAALGLSSQSLSDLIGSGGIAGILVVGAFVVAFRSGAKAPRVAALTGVVVGLLIAAGWYASGVIGFDEFEPVRAQSLTFTAPVGNAIQFLMTYTGASADFGVVAVGGVVLGALMVALVRGEWHLEAFETPHQLLRYVGGGALMGFGGVLALGCTVGAGLSGVSTLSIGSILAISSIFAGALLGDLLVRRRIEARSMEVQPAE